MRGGATEQTSEESQTPDLEDEPSIVLPLLVLGSTSTVGVFVSSRAAQQLGCECDYASRNASVTHDTACVDTRAVSIGQTVLIAPVVTTV